MHPYYLELSDRRIFCLEFPALGSAARGSIVIVPAFAEEMNRTRRTNAWIARELSALGYRVVLFDLSNTGDSSGDFAEATYANWCDDVLQVCGQIDKQSDSLDVLTTRFGSLLLSSVIEKQEFKINRACLIAPLLSGSDMMQEFLKIRVAKSIFEGKRESVKSLTESLGSGGSLDVSGYQLTEQLYASLAGLELHKESFASMEKVLTIFCRRDIKNGSGTSQNATELALDLGERATTKVIKCQPYWAQELAEISEDARNEVIRFFVNQ